MQTTIPQTEQRRKRNWLAENRGVLSRIAREMNYTPSFVRDVFWEAAVSKERRIELRLIELGAPGFKTLTQKAS